MNMGFENPFARNHCTVIAFTHVARGDRELAVRLARAARTKGFLTSHGAAHDVPNRADWWAQ